MMQNGIAGGMKIVGVGCAPDLLTMQAARTIYEAKRVAGSERALSLAEDFIPDGCHVYVLKEHFKLSEYPDDTVVLCTGDPKMVGLEAEGAEYVPGISSLQLAFNRLDIPLDRASVVPAFGKGHTTKAITVAVKEVKRGKAVFVVADPNFSVTSLARSLMDESIECRMAVCQDLGYEAEKIILGTSAEPPMPTSSLFAVVVGDW